MGTTTVGALTVHPPSVAATRLRLEQYRGHLAAQGLSLEVWTFFRDEDLVAWFGPSHRRRAAVVLRALRRIPAAVRLVLKSAVVIIHREALPFGPPALEAAAARLRPVIWDVDDAIWLDYPSPTSGRVPRWIRATAGKHRRICNYAVEVWAGSEVLASWCRNHNPATTVIPTVVAVPGHRPPAPSARVVSWIGTHSTAPFLETIISDIASVEPPPRVVVVGASIELPVPLRGCVLPWSLDTEEAVLAETRVGVYPIDRQHPLAEGKCGLKAIHYMSRGIPVVVTPTTTNAAIVRDGVEGLHADSGEEWKAALQKLLDDDELWERCSVASHRRALRSYSLASWGPHVADRISRIVRDRMPSAEPTA